MGWVVLHCILVKASGLALIQMSKCRDSDSYNLIIQFRIRYGDGELVDQCPFLDPIDPRSGPYFCDDLPLI